MASQATAAAPSAPVVNFDVDGARAAGYSDTDIASYLGSQASFDVDAARKAGYDDSEIVNYLAPPAPAPTPPPPEKPAEGTFMGIAKAAGQGLVSDVGSIVRGIGAMTQGTGTEMQESVKDIQASVNNQLAIADKIDSGVSADALLQNRNAPGFDPDFVRAYSDASQDHRAEVRAALVNSAQELVHPEDTSFSKLGGSVNQFGAPISQAGQSVDQWGNKTFPLTDEEQQRFSVKATKMTTGLLPYIGAAAAGDVPALVGAGGVIGFGDTYDAAKKAKASDADAAAAGLFGGLTQAGLMTVPVGRAMEAMDAIPGAFKGQFIKAVTEMAKSGVTMTAFSQLSTLADNVVAKNTYDPDRALMQGVGQDIPAQFAAGMILPAIGAGGEALTRRIRPDETPPIPVPEGPPPEVTAAPVMAAGSVDDAIGAAQAQLDKSPIDIEAMAAQAKTAGEAAADENDHASLQELFASLDEDRTETPASALAPETPQEQAVALDAAAGDESSSFETLADIQAQARDMGEPLTDDETHQILDNIVAHGIDPESAIAEHIERKAIRGAYLGDEDEHATTTENQLFAGAASGADIEAGTIGKRPEQVVGDADGTRAPDSPIAQNPEQGAGIGIAPASFTTAKGSTYEIHDDGTTTRDKAARPDLGHEGQYGPQPRSEATYYVTPEQADQLSLIQTQGGPKMALAARADGSIGVKYLDGKDAGKFETRTVITPQDAPAVGLTPVETFHGGSVVHFGNKITSVASAGQPDREPGAAAPSPPAVRFDVAGARAAGHPDADIASYLGDQTNFDVDAARKAGYDDKEIIDHLAPPTPDSEPAFTNREAAVSSGGVQVRGRFTPEFDAARSEVAPVLRAKLDQLGLHDIALKLPDTIHAVSEGNATAVDGVYLRKTIAVALDTKDMAGTLDHEAIHALRSLGLFTKSEWSMLSNRAATNWRATHNIDSRYAGLPEEKKNEEAVAEAFRAWVNDRKTQKGIFARIFDKVRNALAAIGSALRGRGFATADSVFGRINSGEIGARPRVNLDTTEPLFSRRDDAELPAARPEERLYRDQVSDLIENTTGGSSTIPERLLKIAAAGEQHLKNLNPVEAAQTIFPRTLATLDGKSARFWNAWMARDDEGRANAENLRQVITNSLVRLPAESRDRVYAALELSRKFDFRPPDDGRPVRVRNTSYWQAQKSRVGDDYVLSAAETKAFHDTLKLGDEGWRTFMAAMAAREGWHGAPDPAAIIAAANNAKTTGLPEGKRLLRLAAALTMAQDAIKHPYFPAARFGDYFLAVRPKMGADASSTGGYPRVEWFETVEKPLMSDILGKARTAAHDLPAVQEAIARIRAMKKPDGSLAFPEESHDIEAGDLRTRPDVLRKLNIPAIEKLFMMMERGFTEPLKEKIIAEGSPEDAPVGKGGVEFRQGAAQDAKARFQGLLGEAKDALLDAMYQDLVAGWKKHASLTPGYSADFDRAIGTHIGQVSRNAATMVHHDAIEDAYQDIQDNHPHQAVKKYWQHWREYQDDPRSPLSRAAANTAQLGAAYVMALNPSTTMMIAAHTPMMAVPVLGVGGRTGQAALHMMRATREAYQVARFDTRKGASIDISKLGSTPGEKALIADLHRIGMLHSVGADDVRAINDRQSGLWGEAAPVMRRALDISMSNISIVDQANRAAIALSAHRMASNPATLEKMAAPWMEHNAIFREMVLNDGLTPENFTKFMMSEAGGAWGRTNQAPMMRGTEGSLLFALHGFQIRYLSTAYRLMRHMGPEGRVAAAWMMGALTLGAGAMGLPFTQDLENAGDALLKRINGVDPMIDAHIRQFLGDVGFSKIGSEILLRGPLSVGLGVDFGSRLGFGDILSRSMGAADLMGTIPSILFGRLQAAWNREMTGQGNFAAAAELLPAALRNPARAAIEADRGQISQHGSMLLPNEDMGAGHAALRAVGLPALDTVQAETRSDYLYRLKNRDNDLRRQTETSAASLILQAGHASRNGDQALARELSNRMSALVTAYDREHWQAPITQQGLNDAILQMSNPEIYQKSRLPSGVRGEAQGSPYP